MLAQPDQVRWKCSYQSQGSGIVNPSELPQYRSGIGFAIRLTRNRKEKHWAQNQCQGCLKPKDDSLVRSATFLGYQRRRTHPNVWVSSPARTAPEETPVVKPALINPTKRPLRLLLVRSSTRIMHVLINPPLPHPETTRPRRKTGKLRAAAVTKRPIESSVLENMT